MKQRIEQIALNEQSNNVSILHQVLSVLGHTVLTKEVSQSIAGNDTTKKVRALQRELGVQFDNALVVDEVSALSFSKAIVDKGLVTTSHSFKVSGKVQYTNGVILRGQQLVAYDLDLLGVAMFREVKTLQEIFKNKGFEFLGHTVTDNQGNYTIEFFDWQYRRMERKMADVVVYAVDNNTIVARSRMVNTEDYSNGFVRGIDLKLTSINDGIEYELLMKSLSAFLKENNTNFESIAASQDQLTFTANELDIELLHLNIAVQAFFIRKKNEKLNHELLYGIGRQNISLEWTALFKKQEEELQNAIAKSIDEKTIKNFKEREIADFIKIIQDEAAKFMLDDENTEGENTLNVMLQHALPEEKQRLSFLKAYSSYNGSDMADFWKSHLPKQPDFKDKPELVSGLLLSQQLTALTGNHQALVRVLQVENGLKSVPELLDLDKKKWVEIIRKTGFPKNTLGDTREEKTNNYVEQLQRLVEASYPTKRIASMVVRKELSIEQSEVSKDIQTFLKRNEKFNFAGSNIDDFSNEISVIANGKSRQVKAGLQKLQRVFQVSPSPDAMAILLENGLESAYAIATIPRKNFIKVYSKALGNKEIAMAVHQRASYINTRSEMNAMELLELGGKTATPEKVLSQKNLKNISSKLKSKVPNYENLFGSVDSCECEHCRSIFSPAAYFIDLLQFLEKSITEKSIPPNQVPNPYEILLGKIESDGTKKIGRRPDLAHLALSCENSNTLIPYIDLANEVMEFFVEHDTLSEFSGHNVGDTTESELRSNPQHTNLGAYKIIAGAKFPFSLPYHQALDAIQTYGDHLKISRHEVMRAMNPLPIQETARAIEAEALGFSPDAYVLVTGGSFDGDQDPTEIHELFGLNNPGELESLSHVPKFLKQTGSSYAQLIELLKTNFINPHQSSLDFIDKAFSNNAIDALTLYTWLDPDAPNSAETNTIIEQALEGSDLTRNDLTVWADDHFSDLKQVITLFEPTSKCSLDTTRLRTIKSIYENPDTSTTLGDSGITSNNRLLKIHRFIRLWQKIGWTIHETDLMLNAFGKDTIDAETIGMFESVLLLKKETKLPINQLAALWGNIDTYGSKSLYKKLFLNKTALAINKVFIPNTEGHLFQNVPPEKLHSHQSTIHTAFKISEDELNAIFTQSTINDQANLNLENLSTIYQFVAFAKAVKYSVLDLCTLLKLFGESPFSSPQSTLETYEKITAMKDSGFKPELLEYIVNGTLGGNTKIGLDKDIKLQTAKKIRTAYAIIEQEHLIKPSEVLTAEIVSAKLSLTFNDNEVGKLMEILEDVALFEIETAENLGIIIPENLTEKYTYSKAKGLLRGEGVMTDLERDVLRAANATNNIIVTAIEELYLAPEAFLSIYFKEVFIDLNEANESLINRIQITANSIENKLKYIYDLFIPKLIDQLKKNVLFQQLGDLIGLNANATSLLVKENSADIEALDIALSSSGFSVDYFNGTVFDTNGAAPAISRIDALIEFDWEEGSPDPSIAVDGFSARWETYLSSATSEEYILVVDVQEEDEAFKLFLDGQLILEKISGDQLLSLEQDIFLNAAKSHHIILEYVESIGKAGIQLRWKSATTALEIIPSSATYLMLDDFITLTDKYHRAAQFIEGFKLNKIELNHFIQYNENFGDIDFKNLKLNHWNQINDYVKLRNSTPQVLALLTDVFELANFSNPPTVELLKDKIHEATGWDKANIAFLISHFNFEIETFKYFKNEKALNQFLSIMQIISKTGLSAETIARWAKVETDFDELNVTAQILKQAIKSKYSDEDWLDVSARLSDGKRKNQQEALVSYLLVQPSIIDKKVNDADGLFEYFLIDVQMGACMDTSRIVQASAAIQLFVNRCLLNLEEGISPSDIDSKSWEWRKNYRVWEANRKIFLFTENWLEPEWRYDRSEFFRELESHLVQNDITSRSVEQGLRNYVMSLNEVANLDVCGMHQEDEDDKKGNMKYLHVFGRTHNMPYKYFYRRWNKDKKWSAWEKVQVDIRSVEDGENSGVHLIPVVWKGRLFLFWPEFTEKAIQSTKSGETYGDRSQEPIEEPKKYWEIRLAWSEYMDKSWSPKQVSKEFISTENYLRSSKESTYLFTPSIDDQNLKELVIALKYNSTGGIKFTLSDIQSPVMADSSAFSAIPADQPNYQNKYTKRTRSNKLIFKSIDYLQTNISHEILSINTKSDLDIGADSPFFFNAKHHTYFVRPTGSTTIVNIQTPELSDHGLNALFNLIPSERPAGITNSVSSRANINTSTVAFGSSGFGNSGIAIAEMLEFHTFYHPFSSEFVTRLNQGGISSLMERNTERSLDEENQTIKFEDFYKPNFTRGLVKRHNNFSKPPTPRTAYLENICFDVFGANSLYNWELFFHAPLYIATRLSKNGKYKEAMQWFHFIFNPTTDEAADLGNENARYWKVLPFKTKPDSNIQQWFEDLASELNDESPENKMINEWMSNPFNSHLVASNRPVAYMKHVVVKYVENLIDWGDSLFRQFTRENVYESMQLYVIANHILGPRPEVIPRRGNIKVETYHSLKSKLDGFSNALVALENIFPYSGAVSNEEDATGPIILGAGQALYFCIPANEKLIHYWDTVADRLFKIRHCQDIDGKERRLALFAPAIDPGLILQGKNQGLSIGDMMANLSSPAPIYRFTYLLQKANEFCSDVKALGSNLLSVLEKKDAEELSLLRASQESNMIELVTAIRERQILSTKVNKENLLKVRETAKLRLDYYTELLGNDLIDAGDAPSIDATLTANGPLPVDTSISPIKSNVDMSLVGSDESGVKLIPREDEQLTKNEKAKKINASLSGLATLAGIAFTIPVVGTYAAPLGVGMEIKTPDWGAIANAAINGAKGYSSHLSAEASQAAIMSGYIRRTHDWSLQANLAAREIIQIDKQCTSADIQIQIAEQELKNHKQQILNTKETELFLKDKFTNNELYQWMKEQLFTVYKQSYNLAYEMAKKTEKAYQYELGLETSNFIQYGYWENSKEGLLAGEKLQLSLRQLDKSYLEDNRREMELSKNISMILTNPITLLELRETGKCLLSLPETLFDMDFPGHYFRRVKAVSLSIPCIAGPYTSVNCTLRLMKNSMRINAQTANGYEHENDEGFLLDDNRFRSNNVPVTSIATSSGQNDAGMFEFNFRDERYLPFERAGAISEWQIELSTEKKLRQFDYSTITDVILHVKYTAREGSTDFKEKASESLMEFLKKDNSEPSMKIINLKHDFPSEWHKFLNPNKVADGNVLDFKLTASHFPFRDSEHKLKISELTTIAKCSKPENGTYTIKIKPKALVLEDITITKTGVLGDLHHAIKDVSGNSPVINFEEDNNWKLEIETPTGPGVNLKKDEIEELFLVLGYEWED